MFDASQYATLRAVVDRMIPVDDAPGGLDAEVDRYLLTLLQHETGLIPTYTAALTALHHEADIRHHQPFAALTPDQMDVILHDVAAGTTQAVWLTDAPAFVALLAEQCAEGFYADPRQGGNKDTISWRMIGFEERR